MTFQRFLLITQLLHANSFDTNHHFRALCARPHCLPPTKRYATPTNNDRRDSSYESSASSIKGIVSSLTSISNFFSLSSQPQQPQQMTNLAEQRTAHCQNPPPTTLGELLEIITEDYIQNNYLWTGKLDTSCFMQNCKFTDPTISFEGVDKYVENVGNLVPIVEFLLGSEQMSKSDLLDIYLNEEKGFIETRWNMVGELNALPWRPRIDVIGRTKFWYEANHDDKDGRGVVQIYFYDEKWEIPAGLALLQLVTPAGTIANSTVIN
ncbi:hypothetical protein HJC23_009843 [Cyclotella cryptica]|uniref:Plastid lipid-associated protein/fibrillin conserved domain-containing protein n=1 Tax=Cyclotella cryptica TaxID=29204 RepID=A0ABD3NRQ9_9STRA